MSELMRVIKNSSDASLWIAASGIASLMKNETNDKETSWIIYEFYKLIEKEIDFRLAKEN